MKAKDRLVMRFLEINFLELQTYIHCTLGLDNSYFEAYSEDGKMKFRFREGVSNILSIRFKDIREKLKKDYSEKLRSII